MKILLTLLLLMIVGAQARTQRDRRDATFNPFFNFKALQDGLKGLQNNLNSFVQASLGGFPNREVEGIAIRTGNKRPGTLDGAAVDPVNPIPNFGGFFPPARPAWYDGPNACLTVENVDETDHQAPVIPRSNVHTSASTGFFSSSFSSSNSNSEMFSKACSENDEEQVCKIQEIKDGVKRTIIERRRCCYGYRRQRPDGLCKETDLKDMVQTLKDIKCDRFYNMSVSAGLEDTLRDANLTIFCPSDEALEDFADESNSVQINEVPLARRRRQANNELAYSLQNHMIAGFLRSSDFVDEKLFLTMNKDSAIRTNVYRHPQTVLTANCARITDTNNFATNGIVHKVDRVIKPVKNTVADIITKNNDFSILKRLISATRLLPILRDESSHVTVFAPTDNAFRKSGINIEKLEASGCLDELLKSHILENVICSTAINGRVRSMNLLGKRLKLMRDANDQKLYVDENIQVTARDLMGTNGVVHIIDGVVVPLEAQSLFAALSEVSYDSLLDAVNRTGLISMLDMNNVTFLVPRKPEFEKLPADIQENDDKMKDLLLYHAIEMDKNLELMKNNEIIIAKNGKTIRFNKYPVGLGRRLTAQCVPMPTVSVDTCVATLQSLGGVMQPAEGKLLDILKKEEKYSLVNQIINTANNLTDILSGDGPHTILLPTTKVLQKYLSSEEISSYTKNADEAQKFISRYILPEMLCCAGIRDDPFGFFHNSLRTIGGDRLRITRDYRNEIPKIGGAKLVNCDRTAENGVIHELDRIIASRSTEFPCIFGCSGFSL